MQPSSGVASRFSVKLSQVNGGGGAIGGGTSPPEPSIEFESTLASTFPLTGPAWPGAASDPPQAITAPIVAEPRPRAVARWLRSVSGVNDFVIGGTTCRAEPKVSG